jgi:hypothetical protein
MPWSGEHRGFVVAAVLKNVHLSGTVNKQNFRYWAAETLENSMHDLFTAQKLPFGVLCRL